MPEMPMESREREGAALAILVQYTNNTYDVVLNDDLEELIATKKIVSFRRSTGWVDIGRDPVRGQGLPEGYRGPERRCTGKPL